MPPRRTRLGVEDSTRSWVVVAFGLGSWTHVGNKILKLKPCYTAWAFCFSFNLFIHYICTDVKTSTVFII